jgi:hypothetical protein
LQQACTIYSSDNGEIYPSSDASNCFNFLGSLRYIEQPATFVCPSSPRTNNAPATLAVRESMPGYETAKQLNKLDLKHLISDLEKTLVDCLFKPNYAGGIVEVAKAIFIAKDKINFDKLLEYTEKFDSQAVTKRLGFILELLELDSECIEKLKKLKRDSYVLLDTELPKSGKFISRWAIQQNMDTETILSSIYT